MKNIVIGGAWPYANGPLHIGHIAALLPGDILARYYRAKGERFPRNTSRWRDRRYPQVGIG